jgi:hypothetical protein
VLRLAGADIPPNPFGRLALVEHQSYKATTVDLFGFEIHRMCALMGF